jgi:hypothetical protein
MSVVDILECASRLEANPSTRAQGEVTEARVKIAADAMRKADPVAMGMFTFEEICDLARAALKGETP